MIERLKSKYRRIKIKYTQIKIRRYEQRIEKLKEKEFRKNSFKWCKQKLTAEQEKLVQKFYLTHLGREINPIYHAYFTSRNGTFSPKYIPSSIYTAQICDRLNDMRMRDAYVDKNQYERLFPQIRHPNTVLKCINGYFYAKEKPVTREHAIIFCSNISGAIIKPTLETRHGDDVHCFSSKDGILDDGRGVAELFDSYGKNFIVQERIRQHEALSDLNPTSINTIRVLTYRRCDQIEILYAVIRIGRKNKIIDNESAGGISVRIEKDGTLAKYAFGSPSEGAYEKTDMGIVLEGYAVPSFDKVKETVKHLHFQLPFFNLVGWDIAVDENGEPLLIEWNFNAQLSQTAHGPAFGDFTEEILNVVQNLATTRFIPLYKKRYNS